MNKKPNYDELYKIAEQQAGLFTTKQAKSVGYSGERLSDLTNRGKFKRIRQGIYRLVHFPLSRYEHYFLASLRGGSKSIFSHETALAINELSDVIPSGVHLIVPRSASRPKGGLILHTHKLNDDEITTFRGFKITTVERSIADSIEFGVSHQHIKQAIKEALSRGLTTTKKLRIQANRRKGLVATYIEEILEGLNK